MHGSCESWEHCSRCVGSGYGLRMLMQPLHRKARDMTRNIAGWQLLPCNIFMPLGKHMTMPADWCTATQLVLTSLPLQAVDEGSAAASK